MKTLHVKEKSTLGEYLTLQLKDLKRTKIKQMLKFGSVRVNGSVVTLFGHGLNPGDKIDFLSKKEVELAELKETQPFEIIYEDSKIIVVEKPAGLLTIATEHEQEETLYSKLNFYMRTKTSDGRSHVYIVHRLDYDTSGFIVFAKTKDAQETLQEQWKDAVKAYCAVVEGVPSRKEGVLESYLVEDKFKRVYSTRRDHKDAKQAVTRYSMIGADSRYALLEVELETGRKNQIRVQLADMGHPITGDAKYGAKTDPIKRLALHAGVLSILHPETGKRLTFGPKVPEEFTRLIRGQV
ncbi:MAG: RluA family pseudouridine synthase [Candidatus Omnitrophica bacterium]|nr:RluA family pseudouridine synthase [Candidatus Omnitrophota bacterium]